MQRLAAVLALSLCSTPLLADTPDQILERYAELAKREDPAFAGFSAEHGHVESFLKPNCEMVFGRVCTAKEKGDVLSWIISVE
jgi:hypothetical protein